MRTILTVALLVAGALPATARAEDGADLAPRLVWSGPEVSALGVPTRDGGGLTIVDKPSGNLALLNLKNGERRPLTNTAASGQFAYFSVPSRDGRLVAYAWFNSEGFYELRLADADGPGEGRVLYRNREAGFVQPCSFSPNGTEILTLLFRRDNTSQIAMISTADGSARVLRSLQWIYPKRMDLSPDGKYVVYDNLSSRHADERDVFVLAVDGRRETRLISDGANDLFPLWSPTGEEVLFASDRGGRQGLWAAPVRNGEAAGEPRLIRAGMGRFLPLGVTDAGALVYAVRSGGARLATMRLDGSQKVSLFADEEGSDRFSPAYSPDGSALAYLARVSSENYGEEHRAVVVRALPDGSEREAPDRMAHVERLAWTYDGSGLVLQGSDRRGRAGLFLFRLDTGRTTPLFIDSEVDFRGLPGAVAAEGRIVFARGGSLQSIEPGSESADGGAKETASFDAPLDLLTLSPDGEKLAFAVRGAPHSVWTAMSYGTEARMILKMPSGAVTDLAWANENELVVGTSGASGTRLFLAGAEGDRIQPIPSPRDRAPGVAVHKGVVAFAHGREQESIWVLDDVVAAR